MDLVGLVRLMHEKKNGQPMQSENAVMMHVAREMLVAAGLPKPAKALVAIRSGAAETTEIGGIDGHGMSRRALIRLAEKTLRESGLMEKERLGTEQHVTRALAAFEWAMEGKGTDTTVEVTDGIATRVFHANSGILVTGSSYFKGRLAFEGAKCSLRLEGVDPDAFERVLMFLYTGVLDPFAAAGRDEPTGPTRPTGPPRKVDPGAVAMAADMLRIGGLVAECADFVDPKNALSVMTRVAGVTTDEMDKLLEVCALVVVRNAVAALDEWDEQLPLRAVYALAAQAAMVAGEVPVRESLRPMVGRVWEAVRARYGGVSPCDLQSALVEQEQARAKGPEIPASCRASLIVDTTKLEPGDTVISSMRVFGCRFDVSVTYREQDMLTIEVSSHLVYPDQVAERIGCVTYAPQLVTVGTVGRTSSMIIDPGSIVDPYASPSAGLASAGLVHEAPRSSDGQLHIEIGVDPLFALIGVVGAGKLGTDTEAVVKGLNSNVLVWMLDSARVACDPVTALRAAASRDSERDRRFIVGALTDRLADVPVAELLDVLTKAPVLGRLEEFYGPIVSRVVSDGLGPEATAATLTTVVRCLGVAREAAVAQERDRAQALEWGKQMMAGPEPEQKVRRLG